MFDATAAACGTGNASIERNSASRDRCEAIVKEGSRLAHALASGDRRDLRTFMTHVAELTEYEAALSEDGGPSAAYVLRWELLHLALHRKGMGKDTVLVLRYLLDKVHRRGLVAWPSAATIASDLKMRPDIISRHLSLLERGGFIVRTKSHRNGVGWHCDKAAGEAGHCLTGRGSSFTFGKAGHKTYRDMVEASHGMAGGSAETLRAAPSHGAEDEAEVGTDANFNGDESGPDRKSEVGKSAKFNRAEVDNSANFKPREVGKFAKTREPIELDPLEPSEPGEPRAHSRARATPSAVSGVDEQEAISTGSPRTDGAKTATVERAEPPHPPTPRPAPGGGDATGLDDLWFEGEHLRLSKAWFANICKAHPEFANRHDILRGAAIKCDGQADGPRIKRQGKKPLSVVAWFQAAWMPNALTDARRAITEERIVGRDPKSKLDPRFIHEPGYLGGELPPIQQTEREP